MFYFVVQVIKVRRDKIDQLENEFLELERQIAFEQAEILRITELEKEVVASYEPNIRDLETDVSRDEAEEAQIVSKMTTKRALFIEQEYM